MKKSACSTSSHVSSGERPSTRRSGHGERERKKTTRALSVLTAMFVMLLAPAVSSCAQGFTGPGSDLGNGGIFGRGYPLVTVEEALALHDGADIRLRGNIVRALGGERYLFRDDSGEIVLEIERWVWRRLSVSERDLVEIRGEVERNRDRVYIDVDRIRRV